MLKISNYQTNANKNYNEVAPHTSQNGHHWKPYKYWRECKEKGTLLLCWWECKLMQSLWKIVWRFLKTLKIELPYNLTIPLLGIYLGKKKTIIQKNTRTPMFTAPLSPIAKTLKQPNCPSIDTLIKKLWYINDWILLSHRKQQNNAICSNMDGTKDYSTKVK